MQLKKQKILGPRQLKLKDLGDMKTGQSYIQAFRIRMCMEGTFGHR